MRISLTESGRRVARWGAGLLLAPLGLLTFVLFFATGRSIPHEFIPVDQLGFRMLEHESSENEKGKAIFRCLGDSGRCFFTSLTSWTDPANANADYISLNILDSVTMKRLGSVRRYQNDDGCFEISPDGQLLAGLSNGRTHLRDIRTGKEEVPDIKTPWDDLETTFAGQKFVFTPDGRRLLIYSEMRAVHYDLIEHRSLSTFQVQEDRILSNCFFDVRSRPKALIENRDIHQFEVWDIASDRKDASFDQFELSRRELQELVFVSSFDVVLGVAILASAHSHNKDFLLVRSLEDGRTLGSFSFPVKDADLLHLSPDDRFLVCTYVQRNPLVRLAEVCWFSLIWKIRFVELACKR